METEGRGFSDLYRNSSEDLFLRTLMESSTGMPVPTMEMLGFKNLSHNFRNDSEELFKSWLTTGENHGHNSSSIPPRTRQASRRISTELANLSNHQNRGTLQRTTSNDISLPQNIITANEASWDHNQQPVRDTVERGLHASNMFLAKAWFHSSQPMTRSRSSELRRRYVAMQNAQTSIGMEAMHNVSGQYLDNLKVEVSNPNGFGCMPMSELPNTFMSPSNSSSSTFNTQQLTDNNNVDKVSSVVSMLKGTLERKKQGNHILQVAGNFQEISPVQDNDHVIRESINFDIEGFVNGANTIHMKAISRDPSSPSESSAAAPVLSSGYDAYDGPSNSGQTVTACESSRKVGNSRSSENGCKDFRERIIDNLKDDRKRGNLVRYGSVTSSGSVEKSDPTKKRRVERSRKMAEAKERSSFPVIPSDMQVILKRCENLEKEVRSLKLNLSFMNRKDSEQTKQIEELQKQNEDLADEKERLLEEIERILGETCR